MNNSDKDDGVTMKISEDVKPFEEMLVDNDSPDGTIDETKFIKPNIETKLSTRKRQECRDIVLEIKKFGIGQRQMIYLVYLLALELEDVETMRAVTRAIGENRERTPAENLSQNSVPKLFLP